jgi:hypothetical protein
MIYYDLFSYHTHHDSDPTHRKLLDQLPLHDNKQPEFWVLSLVADMQTAFGEKPDCPFLIERSKER